jgi:DNA-binding response OmpR family regulator
MTATARPLSVLVVDDNLDTALGLSLLIRAWGHQPRMTHDGLSAIKAALDCHANLVLLDIGLPGLDGCEAARQLRQQATLNGVVLVAVTGCADDEDKRRSAEAGFDHYLVKPANIGKLQEIVETVSAKVRANSIGDGSP